MAEQLAEIKAALDPGDYSIIPCINYKWEDHCRWLLAEVESLEAELKDDRGVRAVVMNEQYAELDGLPEKSMRIYEAIRSLRQQVERLKAENKYLCGEAHMDGCREMMATLKAEGMEAAAVIADSYNEPNIADAIRAAAKETTT